MKTKKRGPPSTTKQSSLLSRSSISLSQNYLRDDNLAGMLISRSGLKPEDVVIEIGPGTGAITAQLARRVGHVVAVEKDPKLAMYLRQRFKDVNNLEVVEGDFLDFMLPKTTFKVFANIPYNTTSAIVTKLTDISNPPQDSFLVIQEEAAYKFTGYPKESVYALMLKPWFRLDITHHFDRQDFVPAPGVDSVLLRIQKRNMPLLMQSARRLYGDFVTYCFVNASPSLYATLQRLIGRRALVEMASTFGVEHSMTPAIVGFELWLCLFYQFARCATPHSRHLIAGSERRLRQEQAGLKKRRRTSVRQT